MGFKIRNSELTPYCDVYYTRLHEQAELAGSLFYLSTALRYYHSAPRNCGEGLQATRDASSLVYRSVVLRCYRVVTRNGLDTSSNVPLHRVLSILPPFCDVTSKSLTTE